MLSRAQGSDIRIKGMSQGLIVTVGGGEWRHLLLSLEARFRESPAFFCGGRVILDVGNRGLSQAQIEDMRSTVARHQVELSGLISLDPETQGIARSLGLETELVPAREHGHVATELSDSTSRAIVVHRTFRSGQSLRHPGHVVIIGDVNPGAEVVAGGDIFVWGRVRGLVHAGAVDDEGAVICALDLAPTQLRIAGHIARSPEERPSPPVPEKASIRDGRIVAVPWPAD